LEDEMNEIKKGDWVYVYIIGRGDHVFRCAEVSDGWLMNNVNKMWSKESRCHRLDPLKPGDKLEVGDRVAVIGRSIDGDPRLGEIHRVIDFSVEERRFPVIDATQFGWIMEFGQLARLPDCAQDGRSKPEEVKKETHRADDVLEYEPLGTIPCVLTRESKDNGPGPDSTTPCPHPEWEGIWKTQHGTIVRARWVHGNGPKSMWKIKECASTCWGDWCGPGDSWTLIEPAPHASTPGKKLERPRKHGGIKTPWNPLDM
jgi:hypothetical protein